MEPVELIQSPFSLLTFIVAPALLTNATCVLALSTINRMLRAPHSIYVALGAFAGATLVTLLGAGEEPWRRCVLSR